MAYIDYFIFMLDLRINGVAVVVNDSGNATKFYATL